MYSNTSFFSSLIKEDQKIILIAHNGHLSKKETYIKPAGYFINKYYKGKYYALGFEFGSGEYLCSQLNVSKIRFFINCFLLNKKVRKYYTTANNKISFNEDAQLLQLLEGYHQTFVFLNISALDKNSKLYQLFTSNQIFHDIGSTCASYNNAFRYKDWSKSYDGIFYVSKSKASEIK